MQMKLEGNLYLFKCEQCGGILSSPVADVTGMNRTALTTTGLLKKFSGKKNGAIYMKVQDAGNTDNSSMVGNEYTLEELNNIANEKAGNDSAEKKFY